MSRIEIKGNGFHGHYAIEIRGQVQRDDDGEYVTVTRRVADRIRHAACGYSDCLCGSANQAGLQWSQEDDGSCILRIAK